MKDKILFKALPTSLPVLPVASRIVVKIAMVSFMVKPNTFAAPDERVKPATKSVEVMAKSSATLLILSIVGSNSSAVKPH